MKVKVLGTAAAEGIPAVFCSCRICENAIKNKGKEIRSRSQLLINDDLLIDFNADTFYHKIKYSLHLEKIKTLLITHSHTDHCDLFDMQYRGIYYGHGIQDSLELYCNKNVVESFQKHNDIEKIEEDVANLIKIKEVSPFMQFQSNGYSIHTLKANHMKNEEALLYVILKENKTVLVCYDTARIFQENIDYLVKHNIKIDLILIDGTCGKATIGFDGGHMGLTDIHYSIEKMKENNLFHDNCQVIVTHISHNNGYTHQEYVKEAKKYHYDVAYDGLEIIV